MRKKHYDTKLFTTKGCTNSLFCSLCELISNRYKVKIEGEYYDKNVSLKTDRAL